MAWQRVPSVLSALALLCFLASLTQVHAQRPRGCGGFDVSCNQFSFGDNAGLNPPPTSILTASCRNNAGRWVTARLDLNRHLGNRNGKLVRGARFMATCSGPMAIVRQATPTKCRPSNLLDPWWYNVWVSASCVPRKGLAERAVYSINRNVANYNGRLVWNNC